MPLKWTKRRPTASARSTNQSSWSLDAAGMAVTPRVSLAAGLGDGFSAVQPTSRAAVNDAAASRTARLRSSDPGRAEVSGFQQAKAEKYVTILVSSRGASPL